MVDTGAGTARRDDPQLTVRLAEGRDPVRIVVSSTGDLPPNGKLLSSAGRVRTIVLVATLVAATRDALEARGAEVVEMGNGGLRAERPTS